MKFEDMTMEQLMERRSAIAAEVETDGADLDALEQEARGINTEIENRKAAEAKRAEIRKSVASGAGVVLEAAPKATAKQTNAEVRNSAAYVNAYANYIKTGSDKECRALLTENVSGSVPVPEFVDEIVHTAWNNEEILRRCRRIYIRGNMKVAFERSADAAYAHTEGTTAVTEESLTLGIVMMIPKNIKKWIRVSDEVMAMGGEAFVRYIYDELTYQIVKKLATLVVTDIATAETSHSSTAVGVPAVNAAPSLTAIPTAYANLSDEATDNVVIMNKLTYANFVAAQAAGNFSMDPFMGLPVLYNDTLPAYDTAEASAVYMIVGDLKGETINYPEGDGLVIKYDELSEAEADLVKIVGRQYAAHAVTGPGRFVNVTKPSAVTT